MVMEQDMSQVGIAFPLIQASTLDKTVNISILTCSGYAPLPHRCRTIFFFFFFFL